MSLQIWWYLIWFVIWGVFNYKYNWNLAKTKKQRYITPTLFFVASTILLFILFPLFLSKKLYPLATGALFSIFLGIFLSNYYPFYKHIKNGRYFLIALVFDIFFQQTMVVVGVNIFSNFGLFFMLAHLPVLLLKWAKLRYVYLILTFFGGTAFGYLIPHFGNLGIVISFLIHYMLYVPIFYYLRDERKI